MDCFTCHVGRLCQCRVAERSFRWIWLPEYPGFCFLPLSIWVIVRRIPSPMAADLLHCHNIISSPVSCISCKNYTPPVFPYRHSALSTSQFWSRSGVSAPRGNVLKHRTHRGYPCVRALEINQDTLVAVSVGLASIAAGIAIPVFYEIQINNAAKRENDQPCFPCKGTGAQTCRLCLGAGSITVQLGEDENEVSKCVNCEGAGSLTCTTCQGTGIQPRYLDRRHTFSSFSNESLDVFYRLKQFSQWIFWCLFVD